MHPHDGIELESIVNKLPKTHAENMTTLADLIPALTCLSADVKEQYHSCTLLSTDVKLQYHSCTPNSCLDLQGKRRALQQFPWQWYFTCSLALSKVGQAAFNRTCSDRCYNCGPEAVSLQLSVWCSKCCVTPAPALYKLEVGAVHPPTQASQQSKHSF